VLSRQGYEKARDIMLADDRLLRDGAPRLGFGVEHFWLVLFGEPSADGAWALQLDGHHLALNVALKGAGMSMSPSFLGAQPAAFERDGKRVAPLRGQIDTAFEFLAALSEEQRDEAVLGSQRAQLVTGPGHDGSMPDPVGLACRALDEAQRAKLRALLASYVDDLPRPAAEVRMRALVAEIDEMHFSWRGPTTSPGDISYRLQGPSLIVEYACQDLGGDPLDHLHSMYRDPTDEYGASL
jgi:hypothetical protein